MNTFSASHFTDDNKAREYLENLRWPDGTVCPHCGSIGAHYALNGEAHRPGLWKCSDCREQFSVTVGTVFERSKIGLSKWLLAVHLLCSSKKGISSHQIHRTLGVTYKTAWFMTHRIRHAMTTESGLLGSGGGIVEADEAFIGRSPAARKGRYPRQAQAEHYIRPGRTQRESEVHSHYRQELFQHQEGFQKAP
jgi:transposase-like protein